MAEPVLATGRLVLRPWRDEDRAPFAAINADPEVMRYFPATMTREASDAMVARIREGFASRLNRLAGYCANQLDQVRRQEVWSEQRGRGKRQ